MVEFLKYLGGALAVLALMALMGLGVYRYYNPVLVELDNSQFIQMVDYEDGSFTLNDNYRGEYSRYDLDYVLTMVHHMTHDVIIAYEMWGRLTITEARVNTALVMALALDGEESTTITRRVIDHLTKWKKGDFSTSDELHNLIWTYHDGSVGWATGVNPYTPDWEFNEEDYQ